MSKRISAYALALLLLSASAANASLIQWEFTGPYTGGWPNIASGSPVVLDWTFDTQIADAVAIPDASVWILNQPIFLTMGGWRYQGSAALESAFNVDSGGSTGVNQVLLRLFWPTFGNPPVQLDPNASGPVLLSDSFFDPSFLLLPDASVLAGMPPAGGSLPAINAYPATLRLSPTSLTSGANISGQVTMITPEPTSLMLLGTGCVGMLVRRRMR